VFNEWEITPAQWAKVQANRRGLLISKIQAERWHLKPGDTFTMTAPGLKKADGTMVRTLWGELAWQLGYAAGGAKDRDADHERKQQQAITEAPMAKATRAARCATARSSRRRSAHYFNRSSTQKSVWAPPR